MKGKNVNETLVGEMFAAFCNQCDGLLYINHEEDRYEKIVANSYFDTLIGESGTRKELYDKLLKQSEEGMELDDEKYEVFSDVTLFEKENYQGSLKRVIDGDTKNFLFYVYKIDQSRSGLLIKEGQQKSHCDEIEHLKMDTIQENYLFSMIVDLKNDSCINSNTTEVSVTRQDFMELKYSGWRMMIAKMFLPEDQELFLRMSDPEYVIKNLEKQSHFKIELQMSNMQGEYIWVRLNFQRIKGFSRDNPVFVYTVSDINKEMMQLLNQGNIIKAVEEQNERLRIADQEKNQFISNISHEIRTPMNAIIGMSEVALREDINPEVRKCLHIIKSSSEGLLTIINDLLDFSKIEAGKIEIIEENYQILSLVNDVHAIVTARNEEKGLTLKFKIAEDLPAVLRGDAVRLKQIMVNLACNAVKYTDHGTITVELNCRRETDKKAIFAFSVSDTGQGIKAEDMDKLFKPFSQVDKIKNHHKEGTGLGLVISKKLVDLMDGKISVESKYGVGSTFSFEIPQKIIDPAPAGKLEGFEYVSVTNEQEYLFAAPEVETLIVDDNPINLVVAQRLFAPLQFKMDTAVSGSNALAMLEKKKYDIIFMDYFMPEMDGMETTQKIRALDGNVNQKVPIIALTADALSGVKEKLLASGMNEFLSKPIEMEYACRVIRQFIPSEKIR